MIQRLFYAKCETCGFSSAEFHPGSITIQYTFNISGFRQLLKDLGWDTEGGITVCHKCKDDAFWFRKYKAEERSSKTKTT